MNALRLTVALAAALALSPLHANDSRLDDEPQLVSDSQFSAVFDQSESRLTLISDTGNAVLADLHCRDDRPLASGLWLIVRDGLGGYELLAPSVTVLAPGEPDRVALLACDSANSDGLHLPADIIEQLAANHGAVRVDD